MKKIKLYRNGARFLKMYLGLLIISMSFIVVLFLSARTSLETDIKELSRDDITSFSNVLLEEMSQLSTDIFLITDLLNVHESLIINDGSTVFDNQSSRDIIETELLVWLGMKNAYDQIRIIDNTGQEIVRANFNNGSPYIVEESELQNKADRYYFTDSIILNDRDLYLSVLDLNVENGEIEIINGDVKPMLRVATPIFNEDGVKLGVVIVNYLVNELFDALDARNININNQIEIINENGYYLYAMDNDIEFGFMYDDLTDEVYSKYHDYDIFNSPSGVITSKQYEDEYYTTLKISSLELTEAVNSTGNNDINIIFGSKELIIFTELDLTENTTYQNIRLLYISITIVSIIVLLVISRLLDESIYLNRENIKRMKYDSMHDLLTTLPNRKNIYEHIQNQLQRKNHFTLLFIDFDGFKNVNDQFGHDTGDEALIKGSQRIKNSIRFDDVLGRVGGDEFIVILKDLANKEVVSRVCNTIVSSFKEPFDLSGNIASMGVSIGAFICVDSTSTIEEIVSKSDQAMYKVKNSGKNNFLIFNE